MGIGAAASRMSATCCGARSAPARPMSVPCRPTRAPPNALEQPTCWSRTAARTRNSSAVVVVLEDGAPVGLGELHGVGDDRGQDLVRIEARAHRLADAAERLELVDLARELVLPAFAAPAPRSTLRMAIAACAGERRQHLDRPVGRRAGPGAPRREDADDLAVEEHRDAEDGAVAGHPLEVVHARTRGQRARPRSAGPADRAPTRPMRLPSSSAMWLRRRSPGTPSVCPTAAATRR